jgi:hypothetical protein
MHVRLAAVTAVCFAACALALAADAEGVTGTIVKVDKAKKTLTVKTDDGVKTYSASKETKFFGPRRGASEDGIEDERLTEGTQVRIVPTANGRWLKEVHMMSAASTKRETATKSDKMTAQKPKSSDAGDKADSLVRGTIVELDKTKKTITVKTDEGTRTFSVTRATKFMGPRNAASEDGINDSRLSTGAEVDIVPTRTGRTAHEIHMMAAARTKPERPAVDTSAKSDKGTGTTATMPSAARTTKAAGQAPVHHTAAKPVDGVEARITAVDQARRHLTVELKSGGKKDLTVMEETEFIGPRGGVSDKGIKDDRVVPGADVTLVFVQSGRVLKEVHLPYRNDIERNEKSK